MTSRLCSSTDILPEIVRWAAKSRNWLEAPILQFSSRTDRSATSEGDVSQIRAYSGGMRICFNSSFVDIYEGKKGGVPQIDRSVDQRTHVKFEFVSWVVVYVYTSTRGEQQVQEMTHGIYSSWMQDRDAFPSLVIPTNIYKPWSNLFVGG